MSLRLPKIVKELLSKSIDSATQAISTYNDPRSNFRTGNFTVLMSIAWTSLMHAYFENNKIKYFYKNEKNGRYIMVDGDKKAWDLAKSIEVVFDVDDPIRKNIELFIKLRNKIEHRSLPALDRELIGECQAIVLNFEDWLFNNFGEQYVLIDTLFVPIQLSRTKRTLPISKDEESAIKFVKNYRGFLDANVENSQQYSFKAYLVPKIGNHRSSSDLAIEFVKYDPSDPDEMKKYDKAIIAIKEKYVPVANQNLMKPSSVLDSIRLRGYVKSMNWHAEMWKKYKVRPASNATNKESCKTEYCVYDKAHQDYLYKDAWVSFLLDNELTS